MFKLDSKATRNLNKVQVDGYDLENLGLYLNKDYVFTYTISEEVEEIYVLGREMPYYKTIRKLPINVEIEFNIRESIDFNARYKKIVKFIKESKEKVLTFNNEDTGFKIYHVEIGDINRGIGSDSMTIKFTCYSDIVSVEN